MKLSALHKDKWYPVKDIAKSEDSVHYQLDGIDGRVYSKDISDVKIDDARVNKGEIVNPDGSIVRFDGKERLAKPLSKGINLLDKWNLIKIKLNNQDSFKSMDVFNDQQPEQSAGSPTDDASAQQQEPTADATEQPQQQDPKELQQPAEATEDSSSETAADPEQTESVQGLEGEELEEALKELGYSDMEIAHILEGHAPAVPSEDEQDHENHKQNLSQDEEGHEQTLGHRDNEHEVDLDHKKKMNELELDYSKREKELKLRHLEEEFKIKHDKIRAKDNSGDKK